jgi:hypothetical protein
VTAEERRGAGLSCSPVYAGVVKLCGILENASFAALAGAFACLLVPIALVY